ncbi:MAG TPA: adenine deaminase [Flavobacteriaceae bacterium]|nr:adenine deaminase [Flavobacteriaceae bacterium]
MEVAGQIVDIANKKIFPGKVVITDATIARIVPLENAPQHYIIPGFVDAHIHIESSMLVPSEFAKIALKHGTVATVSDPHEIANVLGLEGVRFMIENGKKVPLKFYFGAPSCVPATTFESAGATIDATAIKELLQLEDIKYLAEMMNYPGVIFEDTEVLQKIKYAQEAGKPVDGHAPGLRGDKLTKYIEAGITTDHESFSYEEALEKLQKGMKILIREGSAAKNFEALIDLLPQHYKNMMFCSDDKHPDDLLLGHINQLCERAVAKGIDIFKVLQVACVNPVEHYNLSVGLLRKNDTADFIVVEDLTSFKVKATYINGKAVYTNGTVACDTVAFENLNNFSVLPKTPKDFKILSSAKKVRVIEALDGELITNEITANINNNNGTLTAAIENDILKFAVVNRYHDTPPTLAFIKNFGLKKGAIASSVGHDSHNILCVATNDNDMCAAVNLIIENKGGIAAVCGDEQHILPLPVAGIMSDQDAETVGKAYAKLDQIAKSYGSTLKAPYMTLSFMALLVIPSLKLSDKGLFDGTRFQFTDLAVE